MIPLNTFCWETLCVQERMSSFTVNLEGVHKKEDSVELWWVCYNLYTCAYYRGYVCTFVKFFWGLLLTFPFIFILTTWLDSTWCIYAFQHKGLKSMFC